MEAAVCAPYRLAASRSLPQQPSAAARGCFSDKVVPDLIWPFALRGFQHRSRRYYFSASLLLPSRPDPPSRPLASSTRNSSFAEFYVSLLKRLCAPTPTRDITGSAPHGWHHASTLLSDAIAASAVHRRRATRLPVRLRMGVSPEHLAFGSCAARGQSLGALSWRGYRAAT